MTKAKVPRAKRMPSDGNRDSQSPQPRSKDSDLAALQAHFLASFAGADFEHQRKQEIRSGKMKANEATADESSVKQAKSKASRGDVRQDRELHASASSAQPTRRAPVTVVFDEGGSRGGVGQDADGSDLDARKNWKDFMNTKTSNTGPDAFSSASEFIRERNAAKQQKKRDAEAKEDNGSEDEAAQVTNDRQLSHLLNTTLFARGGVGSSSKGDGQQDKPDLSSHDTLSRILDLSSSSHARKGQVFGRGHGAKALKTSQLKSMPAKMREGIRSAAGDRAEKEVERNKEMGLLSDAYSRKMMGRQYEDETMTGKKRENKDRVRGLSMGVGKFKGGVLKLSKEEVSRMTGEGRERSRGGSSRGGRGGRGGSRGGGPDKRRKLG